MTSLNLSSYNYLGFAETDLEMRDEVVESMRTYGVANCMSRSEFGTTEQHKDLEERIARFIGMPSAVVFGMGFATNSMVLPAIVGPGGLIISDELNHRCDCQKYTQRACIVAGSPPIFFSPTVVPPPPPQLKENERGGGG